MKTIVALIYIGLLLPVGLDALTCYQCTDSGGDCENPGLLAFFKLATCEIGSGYCVKGKVGNAVTRGCSPLCADVSLLGSGSYCCDSDRCNTGTTPTPSLCRLVTLGIAASFIIAAKRVF